VKAGKQVSKHSSYDMCHPG